MAMGALGNYGLQELFSRQLLQSSAAMQNDALRGLSGLAAAQQQMPRPGEVLYVPDARAAMTATEIARGEEFYSIKTKTVRVAPPGYRYDDYGRRLVIDENAPFHERLRAEVEAWLPKLS